MLNYAIIGILVVILILVIVILIYCIVFYNQYMSDRDNIKDVSHDLKELIRYIALCEGIDPCEFENCLV